MSRSSRLKGRIHERNGEISRMEREISRLNDIVRRQAVLLAKAECLAKDFISLMGGGDANGVVLPPVAEDTPANSEALERETPEPVLVDGNQRMAAIAGDTHEDS